MTHRRDFLKNSGAALSAALLKQQQATPKTLRVGFVGVGVKGSAHVGNLLRMEGVELTAVRDITFMKKILICLVVCLSLMACSSAPPASTKPRIALVMKSLANEFFKTMQDGATQHQQSHASEYDLIANGIKDELDVARQVELVEQMIAQQVNAIVIAPADSKALVAVCQRAQAAGIVVINIDNANLSLHFPNPDKPEPNRFLPKFRQLN